MNEKYQIKKLVLKIHKNSTTKNQFIKLWCKIQVKIKDLNFDINLIEFTSYRFFYWCITFNNLKYLDKQIKYLEMRGNIKSVWKINDIFLCIFNYM